MPDVRASGDEGHLIGPEVTRGIAERFLSLHPTFLGGAVWARVKAQNPETDLSNAWTMALEGVVEPAEDGEWWRVKFTDATGTNLVLGHLSVLKGIRSCVYGDAPNAAVVAWMMRPPEGREAPGLAASSVSAICERALFDGGEPYRSAFSDRERENEKWNNVTADQMEF